MKEIIARVKNYAKHPPITAVKNISIKDVSKIMSEKKVGMVIIVDDKDIERPIGVVTERDIVRAIAQNINLNEPVSTLMSSPVITIDVDDPIWKAADIMREHNIRHLVVMEKNKLYGAISIRDLVFEESVLESIASLKYTPPESGRIES
ncbi:MAG: CBS domain-containing protein [Thermoprotei archaeon]|jgi:CBS domain-containing protein